jgi:hypothetical protein
VDTYQAIAHFAALYQQYAEAHDAARQAAIDAGEDQPQGILDRMAAGIMANNGQSWSQTPKARHNFEQSLPRHATAGAQAYVHGLPGNAYTEFLLQYFGPYQG